MVNKTTILIIDDDREVCSTTGVLLEDEYKVLIAFSGAEGLYILSKEIVSLVMLDYRLPDMDGIKVLKNIKENYKIPVIMITGVGDKEAVLKSWRYKADYYFDKPFKIEELKEKIIEILKQANETFPFDALGIVHSRLSPHTVKALEFIVSSMSKDDLEKLSLIEVSAVSSISPKYLATLFKKECGLSFQEIISSLKIDRAKKLLNEGGEIKEISAELGFKYPNSFRKFFKKLTGKSPSEAKK
ncbi:MAG: ATP-binding region ATPase-like protein [Nitrospirae bacterium]|nr:MAG: ATP-binding region ATPase-like protein [Nitrospirota bacterium]